jgi:hypothetical protein
MGPLLANREAEGPLAVPSELATPRFGTGGEPRSDGFHGEIDGLSAVDPLRVPNGVFCEAQDPVRAETIRRVRETTRFPDEDAHLAAPVAGVEVENPLGNDLPYIV